MTRNDFQNVTSWIELVSQNLSSKQLLCLFDQTLSALWQRAKSTLSQVILAAISERVFQKSMEGFPFLAMIKIDEKGIHFADIHQHSALLSEEDVIEAFQFVLVEFLSTIGRLTGETILPSLYTELFDTHLESTVTSEVPLSTLAPVPTPTLPPSSAIDFLRNFPTGIKNLDKLLGGGIPKNSTCVITGSPGAGKTILSQQFGFHCANSESRVIFFQTLSEPTAKTLEYVRRFNFFDAAKLDKSIHFIDLGDIMRSQGIERAVDVLFEHIKRIRPAIVVIDTFKSFDDLAASRKDYRKFCYRIAIKLMAWECTTLLLGEFGMRTIKESPLFSVVDGLILLSQREKFGEQQRIIQILKLRGVAHSRESHPLVITENGIGVYAPKLTIRRNPISDKEGINSPRCRTGILTFDRLFEEGILFGSSILVSGQSGTGKTIFSLEFLYRGAKEYDEKGIAFLFEETEERVLATARKMGWDFESELKRGQIEIVAVPPEEILIEKDLQMMHERIISAKPKRVVIDSMSLFIDKITEPEPARERIYQLATYRKLTIEHAKLCANVDEFTVDHILYEYVTLQSTILDLMKNQLHLNEKDIDTIVLAIPNGMREAASEFSRIQIGKIEQLATRLSLAAESSNNTGTATVLEEQWRISQITQSSTVPHRA